MEVPLQITFKDMASSEFLERLARERVAKLERFHRNIIHCRVVLEVPRRSPESGKPPLGVSVEVTVSGHPMIVAKGEEERREMKADHTAVLNRVFDSVQRQLDSLTEVRRGEVKQHGGAGETGQVVRLFPLEDYGFIEVRGSPDLYFTRNAVVGGDFDALEPGTMVQVTRATTEGPMGPQASSVRVLSAPHSPP